MEIVPAIDLIAGKCVRLTQGDYRRQTTYAEDPLEVARRFESAGLKRLHLVDLDGAKARHIVNHRVLERIARNTTLQVDFGGGVKTRADLELAFRCGAAQVGVGTLAAREPGRFLEWLGEFGPERLLLGADVRNGKIATHGWQRSSELDLFDFLAAFVEKGLRYAVVTDITRDGLLQGPALELYRELVRTFPDLRLIASGGVASLDDLHRLREAGCHATIVGKALYEGRIRLEELAGFAQT